MTSGRQIAFKNMCQKAYNNLPNKSQTTFSEFEISFKQQRRKDVLKKAKNKYENSQQGSKITKTRRKLAYSKQACDILRGRIDTLRSSTKKRTWIQKENDGHIAEKLKDVLVAHEHRLEGNEVHIPKTPMFSDSLVLTEHRLLEEYKRVTRNIKNNYLCLNCINHHYPKALQYFDLKLNNKRVCQTCRENKAVKLRTANQVILKCGPIRSKKPKKMLKKSMDSNTIEQSKKRQSTMHDIPFNDILNTIEPKKKLVVKSMHHLGR